MTRKQRNWAFWILVFSLNLIPLVAQGEVDASKPKDGKPKVGRHTTATTPKATPPAATPQPKADTPPPAATPKDSADARDLIMADFKNDDVIRDFYASKDSVPEPNSSAILKGRIFADCQGKLEISHTDTAPGCGNNAAFRMHDKGGFVACMAGHKKDHCSDEKGLPTSCVFLSEAYPAAKYDLSSLGAVDIQLTHHDSDKSEDHQNICEPFATALHHTDQATITAVAAAADAANKQARIDVAQTQVKSCVHSDGELKTAYHACSVLAVLGVYTTQSECVSTEKLDQHGIDILKNRALHAAPEDLDAVANGLIAWANKHPKDCKKAIASIHTIAKRLATQKPKRSRSKDDNDDSSDPLAGYDAANDVLQNAIDGASCLDADGKLTEMQENLLINRTEKVGEIKGMYSMEYQQDYADLMANVQSNMTDNCNSWEMNTSCSAATNDMRSAMTIGQMVNSANMKTAQSNAALCQMVMRSSNGMMAPPQCQQSQMGGMNGMMGMNGFGYGNIGSSSYGFGRL